MIFNESLPALKGAHAFLSPSSYHWINYEDEKLVDRFATSMAAQRGSELHAFAHEAIRLGIKLPTRPAKTLNLYVNDALGYRMSSEQILFYSQNCFGTADAITFRKNLLRIHDLKTGVTPASFHQLEVYAALFCLEYRFKPTEIDMVFQIYQNDEIAVLEGDADQVTHIMDKIVSFDRIITRMREERA